MHEAISYFLVGILDENNEELQKSVADAHYYATQTELDAESIDDKLALTVVKLLLLAKNAHTYFASLDWAQTLVALLVFAIGVIIFCELSRVLSSIPLISETIEKYERIIVPLVFIPLGLYIMYESGTIETFLNFIL